MSKKRMTGSMNLERLVHVKRQMKGKDGKPIDVLILPIKQNGFYVGEKSTNMNFDLVFNDGPDQYDNDGFIAKRTPTKLVYPDKKWNELTEEEKNKINDLSPIMGNFRNFGDGNSNVQEAEIVEDSLDTGDDMPFWY